MLDSRWTRYHWILSTDKTHVENNKINPGEFCDSLTLKMRCMVGFQLVLSFKKKFLPFSAASFMVIFFFVYGHLWTHSQRKFHQGCNQAMATLDSQQATSLDITGCKILMLFVLFNCCMFIFNAPFERCLHVGRFLARFLQHSLHV